ncbi:hypothetical protein F5X96DRAFT_651891 [Biscogniauxia mediterranea]|nr:hypothetical protein F5X96DRAFT_651891 [Biscogniauxia mediterranea]
MASGSLRCTINVWDIEHGILIQRFGGPGSRTNAICSVAFFPNNKNLISGSFDRTVMMWELATPPEINQGRHVKIFQGHLVRIL